MDVKELEAAATRGFSFLFTVSRRSLCLSMAPLVAVGIVLTDIDPQTQQPRVCVKRVEKKTIIVEGLFQIMSLSAASEDIDVMACSRAHSIPQMIHLITTRLQSEIYPLHSNKKRYDTEEFALRMTGVPAGVSPGALNKIISIINSQVVLFCCTHSVLA